VVPRARGKWLTASVVEDTVYVDRKVLDGAKRLLLPTEPEQLAVLAPGGKLPALLCALVRVGRDRKAADAMLADSRAPTRQIHRSRFLSAAAVSRAIWISSRG
jgi:hypothetical protein